MQNKCGQFFTSYRQENRLFKTWFERFWLLVLFVGLILYPLCFDSYVLQLCMINIAIIAAVSLNVLTGACGQISLGQGAFVGVGAYAGVWFVQSGAAMLPEWMFVVFGGPFIPAILCGGLVTALVGMFFGIPSLRLKGIYLAIATLAAQFILEYVFLHWKSVTGGHSGMAVPAPEIFGYTFDTYPRMFYLTLACAVLMVYLATNLMRSKPGRAFVSIRDHHLSAEIVGVNLFWYKLQAFAVSAFMAGVAGGLWAHTARYLTPSPTFGIGLSISYLAMIIIGGLGSVLGAVYGAIFISVLPICLDLLAELVGGFFPELATPIKATKGGVFGLVLMLFLIFEPEGLAHRWRLIKAYWKLYPFAH
ncbi:MAG: branched-chain amino acid ABC transporter permease [Desulfovibrio sp.]|nr:MAG: branched-chain amino acid ABC transporter permease [Desulfovibrio sp.]